MGKNKSATNPTMCRWVNPDIFESDDVAKSCPASNRTINQYGGTGCSFSWRMLLRNFTADESWVPEWIRIPDACGQVNSIWIHYVWTGKLVNPKRKSCGPWVIIIPIEAQPPSNLVLEGRWTYCPKKNYTMPQCVTAVQLHSIRSKQQKGSNFSRLTVVIPK